MFHSHQFARHQLQSIEATLRFPSTDSIYPPTRATPRDRQATIQVHWLVSTYNLPTYLNLVQTMLDDNWLNKLDLKEFSSERSLAAFRVARSRLAAEERVTISRLKEISILRGALRSDGSENKLSTRARHALATAHAVRETLLAEKRLIAERISEAELRLQAEHDAEEAVDAKLVLAEQQLGELLVEMNSQGLSNFPAECDNLYEQNSSVRPWQNEDSDSELESDMSGLESFYDATDGEGG
jgi:hypothetical protein